MVPLIRCTRDAGELVIWGTPETGHNGIISATLRCTLCAAEYPIVDGIVRLLEDSLTAENQHEMVLRDGEYQDNNSGGFKWGSKLNDRIEVALHMAELEPLDGKTVLEFGCGDGRFTIPMVGLGADVLGVDFSLTGLYQLGAHLRSGAPPATDGIRPKRNELAGHVGLVQADATRFNAAPQSFDRALSATPLDSRDERMSMYHTIADALKNDGHFVGGVEHDDLRRRLLGEPIARRYTAGGIFIEHFDKETMRREATPYFNRLTIRPIRPRIPFLQEVPLVLGVAISRMVIATPILKQLGEILLMRAEKPVRPPAEGMIRPGNRLAKGLFSWYWRKRFGTTPGPNSDRLDSEGEWPGSGVA